MSGRPVTAAPGGARPGPRGPIRWELSAKPDGGTRRLIRLSASDERAFARAAARLAPWIESGRGPSTFAHGIERIERGGLEITPWVAARRRWGRAVDHYRSGARTVAITDVRDCYASIAPIAVADRLSGLGAPPDAINVMTRWLRAFEDEGVIGLPVGPTASAVLAEAVLTAGDLVLGAGRVRHTRWVDDVAIFADDRRTAVAALDELRRTWVSIGLEPHDGKTAILDPETAAIHLAITSPSGPRPLR